MPHVARQRSQQQLPPHPIHDSAAASVRCCTSNHCMLDGSCYDPLQQTVTSNQAWPAPVAPAVQQCCCCSRRNCVTEPKHQLHQLQQPAAASSRAWPAPAASVVRHCCCRGHNSPTCSSCSKRQRRLAACGQHQLRLVVACNAHVQVDVGEGAPLALLRNGRVQEHLLKQLAVLNPVLCGQLGVVVC